VKTHLISINPESVSQKEMEMITALDNQIRALQSLRDRQCLALVGKFMAGARVEPGPHCAHLVVQESGAAQVFSLVVNGKEFH
jgi:hypothetical protein